MERDDRTERLMQARRALALAHTRLKETAEGDDEAQHDARVARALEEALRSVARARHACDELQQVYNEAEPR